MSLEIRVEDLKDKTRMPGWDFDLDDQVIYLFNYRTVEQRQKMLKEATKAYMREYYREVNDNV